MKSKNLYRHSLAFMSKAPQVKQVTSRSDEQEYVRLRQSWEKSTRFFSLSLPYSQIIQNTAKKKTNKKNLKIHTTMRLVYYSVPQ